MDTSELFSQIARLRQVVAQASGLGDDSGPALRGAKAQVVEFLARFAGPKSAFSQLAINADGHPRYFASLLTSALGNFEAYVRAGLGEGVSPERRAQLDVVSDFLEQAQLLLDAKGVHPVAPIVLVGATLEEFLRTWVESSGLSLAQRKPSLDAYAQVLFAEGLLTKQDIKDITSWGGLRNHAAHGEWSEVADKNRAALMLEGVNLFLRKYSGS